MRRALPAGAPAPRIRVGTQLTVAGVVILAVCVLTLLFSFLGTITSAALLGMFLGTMKPAKWQLGCVALVFPLVSLAFSQLLTFEKSLALALLCFAVFWVSYGLTRAGLYFETPAAGLPAPARIPLPTESSSVAPEFSELQGRWASRAHALEGASEIIEVRGNRVCVTLWNGNEESEVVFEGALDVKQLGTYRIGMLVSCARSNSRSSFGPAPWLYKIVGNRLTIAWALDANSPQTEPLTRLYERSATGSLSSPAH